MEESSPVVVPPVIKDNLNKPPFEYDCLTQIKHVNPLVSHLSSNFDWQLLSELLGEPAEPEELKAAVQSAEREKLGKVVMEIFQWLLANHKLEKLDFVGRRAVALSWVLNPDFFEGKSLAQISREAKLCRVALPQITGAVGRKWGVRNRYQSHAANFKPAQP